MVETNVNVANPAASHDANDRPAPGIPIVLTRRRLARLCTLLSIGLMFFITKSAESAESPAAAHTKGQALLNRLCIDCHGAEQQKGGVRLDTLTTSIKTRDQLELWAEVAEVLKTGDMPPKKAPQPTEPEATILIDWVSEVVRQGSTNLQPRQRLGLRRLTRAQYNATLQDITGIPIDFSSWLPDDRQGESGFTNDADTLFISSEHTEQYLRSARRVASYLLAGKQSPSAQDTRFTMEFATIAKAKADGSIAKPGGKLRPGGIERLFIPKQGKPRYSYLKRHERSVYHNAAVWTVRLTSGSRKKDEPRADFEVIRFEDGMVVAPHASYKSSTGQSQTPWGLLRMASNAITGTGWVRITVRAGRSGPAKAPAPRLQINAVISQGQARQAKRITLGNQAVTASKDKMVDHIFMARIENFGLRTRARRKNSDNNEAQKKRLSKIEAGSGTGIEIFNPEVLPKRTSAQGEKRPVAYSDNGPEVFIESVTVEWPYHPPQDPLTLTGLSVPPASTPDQEANALQADLPTFLQRLWRRPVNAAECGPVLQHYRRARQRGDTPRAAMVPMLTAALCAPDFLYMDLSPGAKDDGRLSNLGLATRLSYFLCNSTPDEALTKAAEAGLLFDAAQRETHALRLLNDPRSQRFIAIFVDQWLLHGFASVAVDEQRFKDFSERLRELLKQEAIAFVTHLLKENRPVTELVTSKVRMLNNELASYYRIRGVTHSDLRPVTVETMPSAGLLTLAGPLIAGSDGLESNPFKRGTWVLERILGTPPPPPPPMVPELPTDDPDFFKKPLKEQIAIHRESPACASCHNRLDPWGLAYEAYDASGRRRSNYRSGRQPIDATASLTDGTALADVTGIRDAILARRQLLIRNLVATLMRYALGRSLEVEDRQVVDEIAATLPPGKDGLRDLVIAIIRHPSFQTL